MLPIIVIALDRFHSGFQSSFDPLEPHEAFHAASSILTKSTAWGTIRGRVSPKLLIYVGVMKSGLFGAKVAAAPIAKSVFVTNVAASAKPL